MLDPLENMVFFGKSQLKTEKTNVTISFETINVHKTDENISGQKNIFCTPLLEKTWTKKGTKTLQWQSLGLKHQNVELLDFFLINQLEGSKEHNLVKYHNFSIIFSYSQVLNKRGGVFVNSKSKSNLIIVLNKCKHNFWLCFTPPKATY